jgi:uncharacterized membrane protein YphA (DoxX/SURF4 family)
MKITRNQAPQLLLRAGLAVIFLYAAISSFANPQDWVGYLPPILTDHIESDTVLHIFSVYEIFLAACLLLGLYVRYVALLCAATLAGIVFSNFSLFQITFRDIALIFSALALAVMPEDTAQKDPTPTS